jgi:hypothetical protein
MNENFINEINKKRKKIWICLLCSFIFLIFAMCFLQYSKNYSLLNYIIWGLILLPLIYACISYSSITKDISNTLIYIIAEQIAKFKKIPLSNLENREYDSYLPSEIDWSQLPTPPEKVLFSTILPKFDIYNIELRNMFNCINNLQQKVNLCELTVFKDFHFGNPEREFSALLLTIKTDKNLNSITYFQTHFAWKEDSNIKLSKINLDGNIDVYSNNEDVAKKLLTPQLKETLNKLKKQFKVEYAKAVFYNEYIVFVLRSFDEIEHNYFPVNISLLTSFDISKAGKAVKNFQTLYDLANQAPEFTKNI